jgi:hypothetical protein
MLVIAQRQLRGVYGLVSTGDKFDAPDDVAKSLLHRGLATEYERKDIVPAEQPVKTPRAPRGPRKNKAAQPEETKASE